MSKIANFHDPTPIPAKIWRCSLWSRYKGEQLLWVGSPSAVLVQLFCLWTRQICYVYSRLFSSDPMLWVGHCIEPDAAVSTGSASPGEVQKHGLTWLVHCCFLWNIAHRPLVSIQLCLMLPCPYVHVLLAVLVSCCPRFFPGSLFPRTRTTMCCGYGPGKNSHYSFCLPLTGRLQ